MSAAITAPQRHLGGRAINPWIIALTVTLATFMEVLDTSVANVALPHIAGSLSAGQDESTWMLTSYLVSNAIILPMSGWLFAVDRAQTVLHVVRRAFHHQLISVRFCAIAGHADFFSRAARSGWRRASAERTSDPCRYVSPPSAAWLLRFTEWQWCWRRRSGRRLAGGSPTIFRGAGFSSSTFPSELFRCY